VTKTGIGLKPITSYVDREGEGNRGADPNESVEGTEKYPANQGDAYFETIESAQCTAQYYGQDEKTVIALLAAASS
jgi:hypothetical protein